MSWSKYATASPAGQFGAQIAPGDVILLSHPKYELHEGDIAISVLVEVSYDLCPSLVCPLLVPGEVEVRLELSDAELVVFVIVEQPIGRAEILELHSLLAVHGGL